MREYTHAVFIGRFQPCHKSHLDMIKEGFKLADNLIILIGSSNQARTIKNPWTFAEREAMISKCLTSAEQDKIQFIPVRDHFYNDDIWAMSVQKKIREATKGINEANVCLLGAWKDESSYYLKMFPQFAQKTIHPKTTINATDVRNELFETLEKSNGYPSLPDVPPEVAEYIGDRIAYNPELYLNLKKEYDQINGYKQAWKAAPFPPTFVTCDAITICQGHVLVIKRGGNPGKGLYAVPGGFLNQDELIVDGAIRELKEETGIKVPKPVLKNNIVASHVFDYPGRSLRGRTITHAYCIRLNAIDGQLPEVVHGSDAEKCFWMDFSEIHDNEDKFFEDHFSIIQYFINRPE